MQISLDEKHVLLVEDEDDLRHLLSKQIEAWGARITAFANAERAWVWLTQSSPPEVHVAIIDIMLPGLWDGLDLVREIRAHPEWRRLPILLLTARGSEHDVVRGLRLGADDYVVKPYRPAELQARLETLIRRARLSSADTRESIRQWGPIEWDPERRVVCRNGQVLDLTATEYRIFSLLAGSRGRVFGREEILDAVGDAEDTKARTIDVHILHLRRKLGPEGRWLVTRRGLGYAWCPEPVSTDEGS